MSDELKRDYQEKLGKKFGTIFNGVSYDWANGLVRLNEYRALFGDQGNIEFINSLVVRLWGTCSKFSGAICCSTSAG